MVLSKEEFLQTLQNLVGDSSDDSTLEIIENFTDTYNDLEGRSGNETEEVENLKKQLEENDKNWRKKYKERFFSGSEDETEKKKDNAIEEQKENVKNDAEEITFSDLFERKEG